MLNTTQLQIQQLDRQGLDTLVSWAKAEGWNPGPYDADVFWATDPEGFVGYYHNDELIGGGSVVAYNGLFGFMGFFIVKPEYRSVGIGRKLWYQRRDMLLSRLQPGAAIGMDGVLAIQPFYEDGGFSIAFRDERYERTGTEFAVHHNVTPVSGNDIPAVLDYDTLCFGVPRLQFMDRWLNMPESKAFKYMDEGNIRGVAVLRKADTGYKIGPLFADNANIAEELYKACLNEVPGEQVYLDIPVANTAAVQLVQKYNATYVFECARMYYGTPPALPVEKIFGITSFELG
ncbi:MAG: GNAT family N-acetyltransferase [Chitinophagales bacterium]|nr:GNAT family N-acetyltransferase [Chitinophagales bacterium]